VQIVSGFFGLLKKNDGASSDYSLSTQITDSLVPMTVLKLAVKAPEKNVPLITEKEIFVPNSQNPSRFELRGKTINFSPRVSGSTIGYYDIRARYGVATGTEIEKVDVQLARTSDRKQFDPCVTEIEIVARAKARVLYPVSANYSYEDGVIVRIKSRNPVVYRGFRTQKVNISNSTRKDLEWNVALSM
jgi:hypothetical protein